MTRVLRAAAAFAAGVAALAVGRAPARQPAPTPPPYTAFPGLKAPMRLYDPNENGRGWLELDEVAVHTWLRAAADLPLTSNATPAEKVRSYQLKAGAEYLRMTHVRQAFGRLHNEHIYPPVDMVNDVYQLALEGEADPATRRRLAEERVVVLRAMEDLHEKRVATGHDPPRFAEYSRAYRLGAEADLLRMPASK